VDQRPIFAGNLRMTVRNLDALQSAMTKRENLLNLLRSRTQAEPAWTLAELADRLYCTERTVQRHFEWLRDYGYLDAKHVARDDTFTVAAMPTLLPMMINRVAPVGVVQGCSSADRDTTGAGSLSPASTSGLVAAATPRPAPSFEVKR
jgi:hypothetical protein